MTAAKQTIGFEQTYFRKVDANEAESKVISEGDETWSPGGKLPVTEENFDAVITICYDGNGRADSLSLDRKYAHSPWVRHNFKNYEYAKELVIRELDRERTLKGDLKYWIDRLQTRRK